MGKSIKVAASVALAAGLIAIFYVMRLSDSKENTIEGFTVLEFEGKEEFIANPLMGFAPQAVSLEGAADHELVYVEVTWREWEPTEGNYDAETIRKTRHLDTWRSKGKHVVFRFMSDNPGETEHRDIPDWLYDITGDGQDYDMEYGKGYSPDYSNPIFIEKHARAVKALGEAFGQDSFFSYVQLGSVGHWGEWHVNYDSGLTRMPGPDICRMYVEPYIDAFPNAFLMMRRPFEWVKEYGFGVYNDMTGEKESTNEWLGWIENGGVYEEPQSPLQMSPVERIWETAPVGGEFTSSLPMSRMLGSGISTTVKLIQNSHMTYIGPMAPVDGENGIDKTNGIAEVLRNVGYRYGIKRAVIPKFDEINFDDPEASAVKLIWSNTGAVPMYWDWDVYLYFLNPEDFAILNRKRIDLELPKLFGGAEVLSTTAIEKDDLPEGDFILGVGIIDPMTGKPAVRLDMDTEFIGDIALLTGS